MSELRVESDAWSDGQIGSKLWLCEALEPLKKHWRQKPIIWLYGGWYGITAFLLLSRGRFPVEHVRSFDLDPACQPVADRVCNYWEMREWTFKAFTEDCNKLEFGGRHGTPDLIINTSAEHFDSRAWFDNIPQGMPVLIQTNNMEHEDHVVCHRSLAEHKRDYPLRKYWFEGRKDFSYPAWSFTRWMTIGIK